MLNPRLLFYWRHKLNQPEQITLNPNGPGVVRAHLIPPKFTLFGEPDSVLILNGMHVVPFSLGNSVLLRIFMDQLLCHVNQEISDEELRGLRNATLKMARKIFYRTKIEVLEKDLNLIINSLWAIAKANDTSISLGRSMMSFRQYAKKYMKAPHRMDLLVSSMVNSNGCWNCSQKCMHCYAAGQHEAGKPELSTEQWLSVLKLLRKLGIPQITFTGGEPTMREDLPKLIANAEWFITRVNTNGLKLTLDYCKELRKANLDSIQVTLYSADKEKHNLLVGMPNTNCWERTVDGIKNALEVGLDLSVNTPLCSINKDYVSLLKLLKEIGVRYVSCSGLIFTGNATKEASVSTQLSEEELVSVLEEANNFCRENEMELSFTSPGWVDEETLSKIGLTVPSCGACLSNMAIAPDGTVVPCQSWLGENCGLGNILKDKWPHIWNNHICRRIRSMQDEEVLKCPLRTKGGKK